MSQLSSSSIDKGSDPGHDDDNCSTNSSTAARKERPSRTCATRGSVRLQGAVAAEERKSKTPKTEIKEERGQEDSQQCSSSKANTQLVASLPSSQLIRWSLRSMWELASILNFFHAFRPLLNINVEFSAEEFETALLTPNDTLSDIHIPLLKAIPPVSRMALGRKTWVTVLCKKLRDWWQWVADGDIPVVAFHGMEVEAYNALGPAVRVVILKALCDIRVEQDDARHYIEDSMKNGVQLSAFRKERVGGDSSGVSYWYEGDPVVGHRLYRETRKVESKKVKTKGIQSCPMISYTWETLATNLDEFQDVTEKLCSSANRMEASVGKKLKFEMLPEIEKVHKKKERLLKKQQREALLLNNFLVMDSLRTGRSLRDRKPVTYTFDDYDRSINEAIKVTTKSPSPEPVKKEPVKPDALMNGKLTAANSVDAKSASPAGSSSPEHNEVSEEHKSELLNYRRRQKPQRYSGKEFVEDMSDEVDPASDEDDIVGEAVYDEEYLKKRKHAKDSSSSGGEEEQSWNEENGEDDEEEDEYLSEESDDCPPKFRKLPRRATREKLGPARETQAGLRRSRRATQTRINYRQYEMSDSEMDSPRPEMSNASGSREEDNGVGSGEEEEPAARTNGVERDRRRSLDLNRMAPGSGLGEGAKSEVGDDTD